MYYTLTGVAFAIVSFVYYGEVTLGAIRGLYNTNIARARLAHALCAISVCLSKLAMANIERLYVCVLRTFTVPPCSLLTQVFGTVAQGEPI
jgi:hypothetical protein